MVFEPPQSPQPGASDTSAWAPPGAVTELQPPPAPSGRPWRWAIALVVVVVVVAAAAIVATSGHSSKSPLAVLTAASNRTTHAGTASFSSSETISEDGRSLHLLDTAGVADFAHKTSELTLSMRGRRIETIRLVQGVEYLSTDLVSMPSGARWVSIRPSDLGVSTSGSPLGSQDPSSGLQFLSAVKGNPRELGTMTIDGTSTTHYAFTVDIEAMVERMARATSKLGSSSLSQGLGALGGAVDLHKVPAQAWIDHDGRVRRFQMSLKFTVLGQTASSVEVDNFSNFDKPVIVAAPPASETIPFSSFPQLFSQLGAGTASGGLNA